MVRAAAHRLQLPTGAQLRPDSTDSTAPPTPGWVDLDVGLHVSSLATVDDQLFIGAARVVDHQPLVLSGHVSSGSFVRSDLWEVPFSPRATPPHQQDETASVFAGRYSGVPVLLINNVEYQGGSYGYWLRNLNTMEHEYVPHVDVETDISADLRIAQDALYGYDGSNPPNYWRIRFPQTMAPPISTPAPMGVGWPSPLRALQVVDPDLKNTRSSCMNGLQEIRFCAAAFHATPGQSSSPIPPW